VFMAVATTMIMRMFSSHLFSMPMVVYVIMAMF
jgi:hypothetical protein